MKILYFDCSMGAAGDMLAASLADLLDDPKDFIDELNCMNIPDTEFSLSTASSCGVHGRAFCVRVKGVEEDEHCHGHSLRDIEDIVENLNTTSDIKSDIMNVYNIIARAESEVHSTTVQEVHFHEVGMLDAVADIAAVCLAIKKLCPDKILASPVHVGCGQVKCAHGILPIPAPATAEILLDVPMYGGKISGELCTPTGAALLKYFVSGFGDMPTFTPCCVGYGIGKKKFEAANCVRAFIGNTNEHSDVVELRANIDDMTGEDIGFATELLLRDGALDVWTHNIGMKKSRPGIMLCVLCGVEDADRISELIFHHTTTLGIRELKCARRVLSRHIEETETPLGKVRKKVSEGYGIRREKFEYDDLVSICEQSGKSIQEIREMIANV